jgi:hypothetical protein
MSGAARVAGESRRSRAGVLSSAKSFFLPLGPAIDRDGVRGYPIDLRVKARTTNWPPPEVAVGPRYVAAAQYGLGAHERWLAGEGERWLAAARAVGEFLVTEQEPDGSWLHREPFAHTFPLPAPWRCGLAQGEAASLLVRLHGAVGDAAFADAARRALRPLLLPREDGGVCAQLGGRPWPEEYPTARPSFVLNGAIFAVWGFRDVGIALDDAAASAAFVEGVDSVAANLHRFDTGWWSLYSLYPHPLRGVASSFYHDLHIVQLAALDLLASRPEFAPARERWEAYAGSVWCRRRAFASKVVFRMIVPRNRLLAHRLPWTRL